MSYKVMIVDDDAMVRRALSAALGRAGFEVSTADDGAPAIVLSMVCAPDLVVVDYNMPTSGLVVVRHLKARFGAAVYVVVLTGLETDATREACISAGADAVLAKPIAPSELRRRLTTAAAALRPAV